jgi:hypothetical protein
MIAFGVYKWKEGTEGNRLPHAFLEKLGVKMGRNCLGLRSYWLFVDRLKVCLDGCWMRLA